jgi:16S rRNA C967 or C1407 C5-methylase (RsmB/RsmF family)
VKKHKALLQQQLACHRKSGKAMGYQEKIRLPRYVRVNTVKCSVEDAIIHFERRGWKLSDVKTDENGGNAMNPPKGVMVRDQQVPNLLVFPAGVSLHDDSLVNSGAVILQDRSSCLSAAALAPIPADAVIADTCAAPGNKTSHAASLLALAHTQQGADKLDGRVLAFERDPKRERMLRRQMQKFGLGQMVKVFGTDFSEAAAHALAGSGNGQADELRNVTHVLVDPSCSGSGLVAQYGARLGVQTGENQENGGQESSEHQSVGEFDIAALAAEQCKLVLAAMSLPNTRVIVYSTCSVHRQENEDVVEKILSQAPEGFVLVKALPSWPHRGLPEAPASIAPLVVRADLQDSTNGFFVARFERKPALSTAKKPAPDNAQQMRQKYVCKVSDDSDQRPPAKEKLGSVSTANKPAPDKGQHMRPNPASKVSDNAHKRPPAQTQLGSDDRAQPPHPESSTGSNKRQKTTSQTTGQTSEHGLTALSRDKLGGIQKDNGSKQSGKYNGKASYTEYRPTEPATRPQAIRKAIAKQERESGEASKPKAKAPPAKPIPNPWAHAIDVD